jgi:hypothetical protein
MRIFMYVFTVFLSVRLILLPEITQVQLLSGKVLIFLYSY